MDIRLVGRLPGRFAYLSINGGEDKILILDEMKLYMERLKTTPRFGSFGDDQLGSDFVFVAK